MVCQLLNQLYLRTMLECFAGANLMQLTEQSPKLFPVFVLLSGKSPAATAGKQCKPVLLKMMQRIAMMLQWRHHIDLMGCQFKAKLVLFTDLVIGPALRPVELHHVAALIFSLKLINAVFITIEWH